MTVDHTNEFTPVTLQTFTGGKALPSSSKGGLADILANQRARQRGVIAASRVPFAVNPTNNDTVGIGGHTFIFKTALAAAAAQTQVKILGSAALTKAALLDAINGVTNTNVVKATTPFSKAVVADAISAGLGTDYVRVRAANKQGGTAVPMPLSAPLALTASISGGASAWTCADLIAAGGKAMSNKQDFSTGVVAITAAMRTAGVHYVELPFTPAWVWWQAENSSGVVIATDDTVAIDANALAITLGGGPAPNLQATDKVRFFATA